MPQTSVRSIPNSSYPPCTRTFNYSARGETVTVTNRTHYDAGRPLLTVSRAVVRSWP